MSAERKTQQARILELLIQGRKIGEGWVPLPQILDLKISQYGTRVKELRAQGFVIRNRTETIGGKRHSWFRLESTPASVPKTTEPKEQAPRTLFGQLQQITSNTLEHETGVRRAR